MLWQGEGSDGAPVSLAATGIFSAACIFEGKDKTGQEVATILRQEAERLGVCKSSASSSTTATLDLGSPELVRATSQIAWGAYNWLTYVISSRNQVYLNRTIIGSMSSSIIANPSNFLRLYQTPGILRIGICHTQVIHVIWAQRSLTHAIFGQLLKRFWVCKIIQTKHQFRNVYHWPLQKESIGSSWDGLAPFGVT